MIVSVHLPKTGGRSFQISLKEYFGDSIKLDCGDFLFHKPPYQRNLEAIQKSIVIAEKEYPNTVKCIHGHFMPLKYLLLDTKNKLNFITWMRDPIERLYSHYHYWKNTYHPKKKNADMQLRMVEEKWTIEQFCLSPELKNFYSQFLWGFPFGNFDFIGITEHYEEDLNYFSNRFLNKKLKYRWENKGHIRKYEINQAFRKKLEEHHKYDMDLYKRALKNRKNRI